MARTYLIVSALLLLAALYVLVVGTAPVFAGVLACTAIALGATGWSRHQRDRRRAAA